jgi:hypothetical protein
MIEYEMRVCPERYPIERMLDLSVEYNTRSIYHLLSISFGQCITIAQVIYYDVFDVIAIGHVHLTVYMCSAVFCPSISSR